MASARDKLQPLQLSDQLEALGPDIDLTELTLALRSRDPLSVIELITAGSITRTIEGASTLSLTLHDRDRALRRSGILTSKTSVKLDGLWFRLVNVDDSRGDDVALAFEDREVNVLRSWPPADQPKLWPRMNAAAKLGPPGVARARFAERLVDDVRDELAIRFFSPILKFFPPIRTSRDRPPPAVKRQQKGHGLPKGKVTVKLATADETQRFNLERVLDVGDSMRVSENILVLAVMTVTTEARANNIIGPPGTCSAGGSARGMFQQCTGGGRPDGGAWPASMDIETDAHAFFEVAQYVVGRIESGKLPPLSPGATCSEIQRDYTWHTAQQGQNYQQWYVEAQRTVRLYLGTEISPPPPPSPGGQPRTPKAPFEADSGAVDTTGMFYRGQRLTRHGRKLWAEQRENNWDCLGRLASEVRWRRYCVSGTVYFVKEADFFAGPAPKFTPYSPGVDTIGGTYDIGGHNATITVACRADRWDAPPGIAIELDETGLYDGLWIVASIDRDLFSPAAKITLKKPRPALPESKAPEYGKGQSSGVYKPHKPPAQPPPPPGAPEDARLRIVKAAETALALEQQGDHYHYVQQRPFPSNLFSKEAHNGIDCSAFAVLVYKAAGGVDDPSGNGYDGSGNTCELWNHGRRVTTPKPGDLVLYGSPCGAPDEGHVGIVVEAGQVVEIGGEDGVKKLPVGYRTIAGYVTVFPEGQ